VHLCTKFQVSIFTRFGDTLNGYYNYNKTCNMQHATKPITTAIKLATLQQNGRHNVHDTRDDVVFTNIFKNSNSMLDGT